MLALLSDHVTDLLSHIALRLLKIIEPYLVEQERMANAQLLVYGSKHLEQNFFFFLFKKRSFLLLLGTAEYYGILSCFYEKSIQILK